MVAYLPAIGAGWLLCLLLLIVFHLLFDGAIEEVRYGLGAGSICAGCALAGLIMDAPLLTFGPAIVTSSGLVIIAWQYAERRIKDHKTRAQRRGEIAGAARGMLTQDVIDAGGSHVQPGQDRRN
jgi:hypothetical protein